MVSVSILLDFFFFVSCLAYRKLCHKLSQRGLKAPSAMIICFDLWLLQFPQFLSLAAGEFFSVSYLSFLNLLPGHCPMMFGRND